MLSLLASRKNQDAATLEARPWSTRSFLGRREGRREEGRKSKEKFTAGLNVCVVAPNIWCPSHFTLFLPHCTVSPFRLQPTAVTSEGVKHTAAGMWREASHHLTSAELDDQVERIRQTSGDEDGAPGAT